ncbi:MAG: redox-sensing transcriptional repressor Rex [Gemmatimonadota bacterium]|uniref:redox-sensing transcriptional repressor Rex n=1 Tax=Candidatus Palauibacter scopulicola TaxID=3056741 RepID=UPI00239C0CF2|nr:redox-sensing transcriptional repressor Rex [Candidatus Palauibacter scopulicola]MDE2663915.1 redox-sensing transcriptional repressor Rex [Candidatus Palauibacter scopulicola]
MSGRISDSTVRRLSLYLRMLRDLERAGAEFVSSSQLAEPSGATSAQVRKDLSHFGSFGKRGRGYSVEGLVRALEEILGLSRSWRIALVGVGKIGSALLGYGGLAARGFDVVAAFDVDEAKIGTTAYGLRIRPMTDLRPVIAECGAEIGVVATPTEVAAEVAAELERAGVGAILNFAPVELSEVNGVPIRTVDIVLELEGLSYLMSEAGRRTGSDA